jgi:hypothetical protein
MRVLEETYGTKHPLTISAYNEVLRIEALEEASAAVEPTHVTHGRLAQTHRSGQDGHPCWNCNHKS